MKRAYKSHITDRLYQQACTRPRAATACDHAPEAHVVYDYAAALFRGEIHCPCRKVTIVSVKQRERWADAEQDSKDLLAAAGR